MTDAPNPSNPTSTPEETARELLACPFCGKQPITIPDNSYGSAFVTCPDANECCADVTTWADLNAGETLADAITAWNTRAALGPPPTEVREGVESTACPECGGSVFGAHVLDSKGQPVCGAMPATPPMRDREAIAEKARELLCDACDYCGVTRPPGHLLMAPFDDQGEVWQVAMCAIERLLSLSPSPCDCLVREALKALMFEVRCNREPLSRPVHKALMRADAALQSPGGEE